jgi:hypothetical protein
MAAVSDLGTDFLFNLSCIKSDVFASFIYICIKKLLLIKFNFLPEVVNRSLCLFTDIRLWDIGARYDQCNISWDLHDNSQSLVIVILTSCPITKTGRQSVSSLGTRVLWEVWQPLPMAIFLYPVVLTARKLHCGCHLFLLIIHGFKTCN